MRDEVSAYGLKVPTPLSPRTSIRQIALPRSLHANAKWHPFAAADDVGFDLAEQLRRLIGRGAQFDEVDLASLHRLSRSRRSGNDSRLRHVKKESLASPFISNISCKLLQD